MSYTINRWNGQQQAIVQDGTVDQSLDIQLVGKNYAGYGEIQNETFLHLLENFAGAEPPNAIAGQVWYDSANKQLKVHVGEVFNSSKVWKTISGAEYSDTAPQYPTPGDFWFDSSKDQLKVRLDQDWLTVGPQNAGTGLTQMVSRNVLDNTNVPHGIIAATVNGVVNFIISEDEFVLNTADPDSTIAGFSDPNTRTIKRGITLANTDSTTGITGVGNYRFWGTAGNSLRFGGKLPSEYLSSTNVQFANLVKFKNDDGFTVGTGDDLSISVDGNNPIIATTANNQRLTFRVRKNNNPAYPLIIDQNGIRPDATTSAFNIGSLTEQWANVYATNFIGTATQANTLKAGTAYLQSSSSALNSLDTIVVRKRRNPGVLGDNTTTIEATQFVGTADKATTLATPRNINGTPFDGSASIVITDDTKLPSAGGTMTGPLVLSANPTADYQAATKVYVDNQFGQGGILGIARGGTNASTASAARTNLSVPRIDGVGATVGSTWNINIAPSLAPITVTSVDATINPINTTSSSIVVSNALTTGSNAPSGPGYSDITSVTVFDKPSFATGLKTWTINKVTGYQVAQRIKVTSATLPSVSWQGVITAVDNIALTITVNVDTIEGYNSYPSLGLSSWSFSGLGDTWRVGASVTFSDTAPITGIVIITNVASGSPAEGQTTLTVVHSTQTVSSAVRTVTATDPGDGLGGNAATASKATNLAAGVIGNIPYQTSANITTFLPIGTQGQLLSSTGTIPEWKELSAISVGKAAAVEVQNKPTETETFYLTFVSGGLPGTGTEARNIYADQSALTYNSNTNALTIGAQGTGYGTVIADLNGDILSPNGTIVLNSGTGNGSDSTFIGNAATATKLAASRTVTLTGDVTGTTTWDTAGNLSIETDFVASVATLSTAYVAQLTAGSYITLAEGGQPYSPNAADNVTIAVNAQTGNSPNTLVARDGNGNFSAGTITADLFQGTATSARYADLAEKYLPDADYEPGTVVSVGGEKEITASVWGDRALGVISTAPAYMMNKDLAGGVYVALKGRVPCKVIGSVRKGQRLVASNNGYAVAAVPHANDVFAIALESSDETGVKVIEVAVL